MAPATLDAVEDCLKDVIQNLFEIQSAVHGYLGPETQQELVRKIKILTTNLAALSTTSTHLPVQIPPEIIAYVEDGRNPDIYTREFVELVQKGNQYLKGKTEAFASFRDVLAEEMSSAMPEVRGEVERVLEATCGKRREQGGVEERRNGESGSS
ncbi:MAG: RNA polymerase II mediator complex subunit [Pleopsidium flavum]|nr:MAG: RNA polymerase II mediator complex subunit [Pleopsidium flavum]